MSTEKIKGKMQRSLAKSLKPPSHRQMLEVRVLKDARSNRFLRTEIGSSAVHWICDPAGATWFATKERARRMALEIGQRCFPIRYRVKAAEYSLSRAADYMNCPSLLTQKLEISIGDLRYRLDKFQDPKYRLSPLETMGQVLLNGMASLPSTESMFESIAQQGTRYEWSILRQGIERMEDTVVAWTVRCALLVVRHLTEVDGKSSPSALIRCQQLVGYPMRSPWILRRMFSAHIENGVFSRLSTEIATRTGRSVIGSGLQEWVVLAGVSLLEDEMGSDSFDNYLAGVPHALHIGSRLLPIGVGSIRKSLEDRTHQQKLRAVYVPDR